MARTSGKPDQLPPTTSGGSGPAIPTTPGSNVGNSDNSMTTRMTPADACQPVDPCFMGGASSIVGDPWGINAPIGGTPSDGPNAGQPTSKPTGVKPKQMGNG